MPHNEKSASTPRVSPVGKFQSNDNTSRRRRLRGDTQTGRMAESPESRSLDAPDRHCRPKPAGFAAVLFAVAGVFRRGRSKPRSPPPLSHGGHGCSRASPRAAHEEPTTNCWPKLPSSTTPPGRRGWTGLIATSIPTGGPCSAARNNGAALTDDDDALLTPEAGQDRLACPHERQLDAGMGSASRPRTSRWTQDSTAMLDQMHKATEQTLQGFMQFWTPLSTVLLCRPIPTGIRDYPVRRRLDSSTANRTAPR